MPILTMPVSLDDKHSEREIVFVSDGFTERRKLPCGCVKRGVPMRVTVYHDHLQRVLAARPIYLANLASIEYDSSSDA
mgnify:CR=1 FL=1